MGTLRESRCRSILVECGQTLQAMAFYIDLNPVRAGLVRDPKDYRWCGYAAAVAGAAAAREGLMRGTPTGYLSRWTPTGYLSR